MFKIGPAVSKLKEECSLALGGSKIRLGMEVGAEEGVKSSPELNSWCRFGVVCRELQAED